MLRFCCPKEKQSKREERYYAKEHQVIKYSWERERPDPTQYQFVNLRDEIAAKLDGQVNGQQFIIDKCTGSCILVLDHTATVNVDDCEKCLIVIGPCRGSVFLRDCKECTVFCACQQFRTRDCFSLDVFLFCASKPIIESSKYIRFRSLVLSYDKLEEHMMQACLSPFINSWDKVYDFTPGESSNFELCPTGFEAVENMDLVKNLESVKFTPELSLFPLYTKPSEIAGKRILILCSMQKDESVQTFYRRVLRFMHEILMQGAQLIATKEVSLRKGDLRAGDEVKDYVKQTGRLVALELAWDRDRVTQHVEECQEPIEVIDDARFEQHRNRLYHLAQTQMDS